MNANIKDQSVQVFGRWFSFKAGQIKAMDESIVRFLATNQSTREMGFVELPEVCLEDPNSAEAKEAKMEATSRGRQAIIEKCRYIINNLEVSMQRDFDMASIKADPLRSASKGELEAYKLLKELNSVMSSDHQDRADEIKKLREEINGNSVSADVKPASKGSKAST